MVAAGEYQILGRAGEAIPGEVSAPASARSTTWPATCMDICNHPDGNMFLPVDESGARGLPLYELRVHPRRRRAGLYPQQRHYLGCGRG